SPSRSNRTAARTSGARPTRSRRLASAPARTAARRGCRTGSARTAAPMRAARSSRPSRPAPASSRGAMIALDANGADRGPDVVAEGARLSGLEVELFGPPMRGISNDEEPAQAVRAGEDTPIVQAAGAVADDRAEA